MPSRATVASTSTAFFSSTCAASTGCWARMTVASCLMIAGLLHGDLAGCAAEPVGVVQIDGRHDGDIAVDHVGGVPGAAHADLDDRHVDRASAKAAYAMPVSTSKKESRNSCWRRPSRRTA